jgi:hypothetical protein
MVLPILHWYRFENKIIVSLDFKFRLYLARFVSNCTIEGQIELNLIDLTTSMLPFRRLEKKRKKKKRGVANKVHQKATEITKFGEFTSLLTKGYKDYPYISSLSIKSGSRTNSSPLNVKQKDKRREDSFNRLTPVVGINYLGIG